MKRGYRLNSAHAYANYYADVTNLAEFGRFDGAVNAVKGFGGRAVGALDKGVRGIGKLGYRTSKADYRTLRQIAKASPEEAKQLVRRRQRLVGAGLIGAGLAGAGGAGYAASRLMRGQEEEEM